MRTLAALRTLPRRAAVRQLLLLRLRVGPYGRRFGAQLPASASHLRLLSARAGAGAQGLPQRAGWSGGAHQRQLCGHARESGLCCRTLAAEYLQQIPHV